MNGINFWVRLAGYPIWLKAKYSYLYELFRDYRIEPSEMVVAEYVRWMERGGYAEDGPICVSSEEILAEQQMDEEHPTGYPEPYLESLAIYRKICGYLLHEQVLLFHCSSLRIDDKAYLFTGPSGTGKSTHVRLWKEVFGERMVIINDDKPLLHFTDDKIWVYGTPYSGKDGLDTNISAQAAGIVILHQAEKNEIKRISARDAFPVLWSQSYRNVKSADAMIHTMDLVQQMAKLPVFSLGCTISGEAVELAYEALKGVERK